MESFATGAIRTSITLDKYFFDETTLGVKLWTRIYNRPDWTGDNLHPGEYRHAILKRLKRVRRIKRVFLWLLRCDWTLRGSLQSQRVLLYHAYIPSILSTYHIFFTLTMPAPLSIPAHYSYTRVHTGPLLYVKAGDHIIVNFTNNLGAETGSYSSMNSFHYANHSNLHTHGWHITSDAPAGECVHSMCLFVCLSLFLHEYTNTLTHQYNNILIYTNTTIY